MQGMVRRLTLVFLATVHVFGESSAFDAGLFARLSAEERQEFIMAIMRDRDAALQNFSYEMKNRNTRFTPSDGSRQPGSEKSYSLRRKGARLWRRAEMVNSAGALQTSVVTWDGTIMKSLTHLPEWGEESAYRGVVGDGEESFFSAMQYNHILGLRVFGWPEETLSVVEWLGETLRRGYPMEASAVTDGGMPLVKFGVTVRYDRWEWTLDPSRGYMPVRCENVYKHGQVEKRREYVVDDASEVDGPLDTGESLRKNKRKRD